MRFFIHITDFEGHIQDEAGVEVSSLEAARAEAVADLRCLAGERISHGLPLEGLSVTLTDEAGKVLEVIPWQATIVPPGRSAAPKALGHGGERQQ